MLIAKRLFISFNNQNTEKERKKGVSLVILNLRKSRSALMAMGMLYQPSRHQCFGWHFHHRRIQSEDLCVRWWAISADDFVRFHRETFSSNRSWSAMENRTMFFEHFPIDSWRRTRSSIPMEEKRSDVHEWWPDDHSVCSTIEQEHWNEKKTTFHSLLFECKWRLHSWCLFSRVNDFGAGLNPFETDLFVIEFGDWGWRGGEIFR